MASSGIDDCHMHIFYGTNFAQWKNHMLDHICVKGPKFWWIVTSGLTHVLDHKNLTKAQKVLFELDSNAYLFLINGLSFEVFDRVNHKGTTHELWESIKHTFGDSSIWDDGESPSLVLVINDTKLLMPCVKCFELGISNTCDKGVRGKEWWPQDQRYNHRVFLLPV
jgi:hypothetical protein